MNSWVRMVVVGFLAILVVLAAPISIVSDFVGKRRK